MASAGPVLVIDDDADFLAVTRIILAANGYDVRLATSADVGLQAVRESKPLVVIVDVMMSYVLDGWAVGREIKTSPDLQDVPIIMVSAIVTNPDDPLFPDPANACFDAFLSKPLEPATLLRTIEEVTGLPPPSARVP